MFLLWAEHGLDGEKVMEVESDATGLMWSKPESFRAATTGPLMMHRHVETPIALQFHSSKVVPESARSAD